LPKSQGGKLPDKLYEIITDPEKRKKLVIYINPPYAEIAGNKVGVNLNRIHDKYQNELSDANRELFAQFLIRIYYELSGCKIGEFSKIKTLTGSHFQEFRKNFKASLKKMFLMPANTFDNVKGKFPIGFKIWDTEKQEVFEGIEADVYDKSGKCIGTKKYHVTGNLEYFSNWVLSFKVNNGLYLGWLEGITRNDFQSQNGILLINHKKQIAVPRGIRVFEYNLIETVVAFSVRHCIEATWLNDRDQFLYPNDGWKLDTEFQNDCLAFTLFHGQNRISCKHGVNHWIPFTEAEVEAREVFDSHFMTDFLHGKLQASQSEGIFGQPIKQSGSLVFSAEAQAVFAAGRELWRYYHQQPNCLVNAALYDIKEHFQGRDHKGKLNHKSQDPTYNQLLADLREKMKVLAKKIEPKVYQYGFLRQ